MPKVGVPRALTYYYRSTRILERFLKEAGAEVVVSPRTTPEIHAAATTLGSTNYCLSLRMLVGHVHHLITQHPDLDYLLIDLPPGTGDVSITIAQTLPQSHMLLVTTPQLAASQVARRAARMAEKVNMEVVGIIENMSYFLPAAGAEPVYVFGRGGGAALAGELEVPLLGEIPLDQSVREGGDEGRPVVISHPDSAPAAAFRKAAERLREVVPMLAGT